MDEPPSSPSVRFFESHGEIRWIVQTADGRVLADGARGHHDRGGANVDFPLDAEGRRGADPPLNDLLPVADLANGACDRREIGTSPDPGLRAGIGEVRNLGHSRSLPVGATLGESRHVVRSSATVGWTMPRVPLWSAECSQTGYSPLQCGVSVI